MIFSLHHVINSLAELLSEGYPEYPVYDSPNQQGTSFPCFFIFYMPSTIEDQIGNRYLRDLGVDIVFVQQRNLANGNQKFHIRERILVEETVNLMQDMEENNVGIKEDS